MLVAGSPIAADDQTTQTQVAESGADSARTTDGQQAFFEKLGWELATADNGVRVERISKNSSVAEAHLEEKDVIIKVAGENVATADRVAEILTDLRNSGETKTDVVVLRDGEELSYLLSLENLGQPNGVTASRAAGHESQDLVAMIQQMQLQLQQQEAMLQMLLTEVQTLRTQLGGVPASRVNPNTPTGTQINGDIVAPLGTGGVPSAQPGAPANSQGTQTRTPAGRNPRR